MTMSHSLRSSSYVATSLGVPVASVHNWFKTAREGFPQPDTLIYSDTWRATCGWTDDQITEMRIWYQDTYQLSADDAATRWAACDRTLAERKGVSTSDDGQTIPAHIHPDQQTFQIPEVAA